MTKIVMKGNSHDARNGDERDVPADLAAELVANNLASYKSERTAKKSAASS